MSFEAQIIEAIEGGARDRNALGAAFRQMHPDALAKKLYALMRDGHVAYEGDQLCVRKQLPTAPAADAPAARGLLSPPSQEGGARATEAPAAPIQPEGEQEMSEDTKTCPQCEQEKARTEFGFHQRRCRTCVAGDSGAKAAPPPAAKKRKKPVRRRKAPAKRAVAAAPRLNGASELACFPFDGGVSIARAGKGGAGLLMIEKALDLTDEQLDAIVEARDAFVRAAA